PEGFIPGHPLWYHFYPKSHEVSNRCATRLFANALEVPGPDVDTLAEAARRADTYVTMGACEKRPGTTGTMFNSQLFFSPNGELIGKHQKIRPTTGERLVHANGGRETFGTVDTEYGPMSGLICGENSNPLAIFALAGEHTRIHCMSWPPATMLTTRHLVMARAFAQMTKSFVVSANSCVGPQHLELMEIDAEVADRGPTTDGGSAVIEPEMTTIAGPMDPHEEGIVYADCDLERSVFKKLTHDFAGHYTRPDMFQVRLDRRPSELYTVVEPDDPVPATTGPEEVESAPDEDGNEAADPHVDRLIDG
ncbi:MAG: nitrilase-related carbon-nitrogen hydrolase, partial [Halobacteriales archaeon]|nr:nitrilase-related carbon-nitrogen hydrolase [Halobacteriales archaeon]